MGDSVDGGRLPEIAPIPLKWYDRPSYDISTPEYALKTIQRTTQASTRWLGARLGLSHTQVRRILSGEQEPRDDVAVRIFSLNQRAQELARHIRTPQKLRIALCATK